MNGSLISKFNGFGISSLFSLCIGAFFLISWSYGERITECPKYRGNFYLASHQNKCMYRWCLHGQLVGTFRCPVGKGVPAFHRSNRSPCQLKVRACSRYGVNAGIDPSTPPPTTRKTTTPVQQETSSSYDVTTYIDDVSTTQNMEFETQGSDVTTEEMSDDPGSGDVDDFMPVGGSTDGPGIDLSAVTGSSSGALFQVYSGNHIVGGLPVSGVSDLPGCLAACSQLSSICTGIDFTRTPASCYVHTVASECSELVPDPSTDHFRFMQC